MSAQPMPRDEAVGPDGAHSRRWTIWHHQFDLVRAEDGETYLRRWWIVKTPYGGIALHRMTAPDARETLHDHPFSFLSIPVRGGYYEKRLNPRTMEVGGRWVTRFNLVRKHDAHSIRALTRPVVWTLLFIGKHRRTWGFWERSNYSPNFWSWTKHDAFDSGHYS